MDEFLDVAKRAARAGGEILLDYQGRVKPREKSPRDLVTEADLASQAAIQEMLLGAFPDHGFLGEEGAAADNADSEYRWIVDPLDGTTNYVHQMPTYSVSVALEHQGAITHGVVLDPVAGETFSAAAGRGAHLNGQRIEVSGCAALNEALTACSFRPTCRAAVPKWAGSSRCFIAARHCGVWGRRL